MITRIKKRDGWMMAFLLLLKGQPAVVGEGYKWKSGLLVMAITCTFFEPFILRSIQGNFDGAVPPQAPLIKETGYLVRRVAHSGLKDEPYVEFRTDSNHVYPTSKLVIGAEMEKIACVEPPLHIYSEGFLLQDGRGAYWPTVIRTLNGIDVLPASVLRDSLSGARDPREFYLIMSLFPALLWIISIGNAYQLKKKLAQA